MSKQSYVRGFIKRAEERGADPVKLAEFAKEAWSWNTLGDDIRNAWNSVPKEYKPLAAGLAGAAGGGLIGGIGGGLTGMGFGRGALLGMGLGGIGGSLYGAHSAGKAYNAEKDEALANQNKQNQNAMDALKAEHTNAMGDLKAEHAKEIQGYNDRVTGLQGDIDRMTAENQERIKALNAQHAKAVDDMNAAHSKAMGAVTSERDDLTKKVEQLQDMGIPLDSISKLSDEELDKVYNNTMAAWRQRQMAYNNRMKMIQGELKQRGDTARFNADAMKDKLRGDIDINNRMREQQLKELNDAMRTGDAMKINRVLERIKINNSIR